VKNARDTQQKIIRRARTAVTGNENKRISDLLKEPKMVKTFDKLSFMLGVISMLGTQFMVLKLPQHFDLWYLCVFGTFMALRFRIYNNKGQDANDFFNSRLPATTVDLTVCIFFLMQNRVAVFFVGFLLLLQPPRLDFDRSQV